MIRRPALLLSLLAAAALGLSACGSGEPSAATPAADTLDVPTATASETVVPNVRRYSGTIQGARRIPLSTKMMGTVTQLDVDEGDRVQSGQTLVRIRSQNVEAQRRQVEARLREARAALDNAQTNFERIQSLYEKESATQKEFDDARTGLKRARARVDALESRLAEVKDMLTYTTVTSPIGGYVVEKRTEEGALASPGRPLLVVETLDEVKAVVQVPESEINRLSTGDSVSVEVGAAGDVVRNGTITQINPAGNAMSRQFQVQVRLDRRSDDLKSGMYAQVLHRVGSETALTVPEQALVQRGQLTGLYAVKDGTALLRWVRTGRRTGDRVVVLTGLAKGETYVANAQSRILDGQPIR